MVVTSRPSVSTARKVQELTGSAVDEHGAGAADLDVAGALRAGEPQSVAQHVEQQLLRLDVQRLTRCR